MGLLTKGSERFIACSPAEGGGRVSPWRATYFLLLRQKKVSKEKATLLSASLRFAAGNLRCSTPEGGRRTRFAQTAAALIPPTSALLGAARRDRSAPSLRSAFLNSLNRPSLRSAGDSRSEQVPTTPTAHATPTPPPPHSKHGRRKAPAVPWWPSEAKARASPLPSGCAEERSVSRTRARSCLSEASSARPRETRAPQVAP